MRVRRTAAVAAMAALVTAVVAPPAPAAPVGPFAGEPQVLGLADSLRESPPPQLATLADGTTMAAWVGSEGTAYNLRVRPAGSSTWGPTLTTPLEAGRTLVGAYPGHQPFLLRASGPSNFLLVWNEHLNPDRGEVIRAQRLTRAGLPVGPAEDVAGTDHEFLADVATNASGRAAFVFWTDNSPVRFTARVRDTESGAWGPRIALGNVPVDQLTTWGLLARVAVHDSGAVCAVYPSGYTQTSVTLTSRCGAPASLAAAPPQQVGVFVGNEGLESVGPTASLTATPEGFAVAGLAASSGTPQVFLPFPTPPTRVRVRTRPAGSGSWGTAATLGLAGEVSARPTVQSGAAGTAVHWVRVRGVLGGAAGEGLLALDQRIAQQEGSGEWTPAQTVSTLVVDSAGAEAGSSVAFAVGPAGEMLVGAPVPQADVPGWTSGFQRRSSWTGPFNSSPGLGVVSRVSAAIVGSGRATALALDGAAVVVAQTALPAPFLRSRAALSSAEPRVGRAVACQSAWTDAASVRVQWLRAGAAIADATARTYTPVAADRGKALACRVTATNPTGSVVSLSAGRVVS